MSAGFEDMIKGGILAAFLGAGVQAAAEDVVATEEVEFPLETAAIVAATSSYFDSIEAVEAPAPDLPVFRIGALAMPASASLDAPAPFGPDRPVRHLTGYRISWYPVDRFLGSVDFMGTWNENRDLVCGYLTWDLTDPDAPELVHVSAVYVDLGELSGMEPSEAHQVLLDANCAYAEIDLNFTVFEPRG